MRSILADPKGKNLYSENQEGFTPTMPERHQSTKRIKKKKKKLFKRMLPLNYNYWLCYRFGLRYSVELFRTQD